MVPGLPMLRVATLMMPASKKVPSRMLVMLLEGRGRRSLLMGAVDCWMAMAAGYSTALAGCSAALAGCSSGLAGCSMPREPASVTVSLSAATAA